MDLIVPFLYIENPGAGNVVRVVNTAPIEFPMSVGVVPRSIKKKIIIQVQLWVVILILLIIHSKLYTVIILIIIN